MSPGRSLAAKIGVRPEQVVALVQAPEAWRIPDLPAGVEAIRARPGEWPPGTAHHVVAFLRSQAELAAALPELTAAVFPGGNLWLAWPRRAGGHSSDLGDTVVREAALACGGVDVKVAALDDDWSALKFVWRKELRSGDVPPSM